LNIDFSQGDAVTLLNYFNNSSADTLASGAGFGDVTLDITGVQPVLF
jgi:hypothetical protein